MFSLRIASVSGMSFAQSMALAFVLADFGFGRLVSGSAIRFGADG